MVEATTKKATVARLLSAWYARDLNLVPWNVRPRKPIGPTGFSSSQTDEPYADEARIVD